MKSVAVIPARGGSKRIPRKNVREFNGRPMLAWPITRALASGLFDSVVVSTDDDEIAAAALSAGAEVPFRRPSELSDDHTPTTPVIQHAIGQLRLPIDDETLVSCIYPATPLLEVQDLKDAMTMWLRNQERVVIAAYEPDLPIARAFTIGEDGFTEMMFPEFTETRTQDLPRTFLDAGWFYFGSTRAWLTGSALIPGAQIVEIVADRAIDIDTEADWERAAARSAS